MFCCPPFDRPASFLSVQYFLRPHPVPSFLMIAFPRRFSPFPFSSLEFERALGRVGRFFLTRVPFLLFRTSACSIASHGGSPLNRRTPASERRFPTAFPFGKTSVFPLFFPHVLFLTIDSTRVALSSIGDGPNLGKGSGLPTEHSGLSLPFFLTFSFSGPFPIRW